MEKRTAFRIFLISLIGGLWFQSSIAWAIEPSPAGGGYLRFPGKMAFGLVEYPADLFQKFHGGITVDGFLFFEKLPANGEALMLIQKPEGFQFVIIGTAESGLLQIYADSAWRKKGGHERGGSPGSGQGVGNLKANTWYYFHCHFKAKYEQLIDNLRLPLAIGAKCFSLGDILVEKQKLVGIPRSVFDYVPFIGGLDELRISNAPRYPNLRGSQQVFLGDSVPEWEDWEIPRKRLKSDENTIALWHFDDPENFFTDEVNGLVIRPHGALKMGQPQ